MGMGLEDRTSRNETPLPDLARELLDLRIRKEQTDAYNEQMKKLLSDARILADTMENTHPSAFPLHFGDLERFGFPNEILVDDQDTGEFLGQDEINCLASRTSNGVLLSIHLSDLELTQRVGFTNYFSLSIENSITMLMRGYTSDQQKTKEAQDALLQALRGPTEFDTRLNYLTFARQFVDSMERAYRWVIGQELSALKK